MGIRSYFAASFVSILVGYHESKDTDWVDRA